MRVQLAADEAVVGKSSTLNTWSLETSKGKRYFSRFSQLMEALRLFMRVDEKEGYCPLDSTPS